MAEREKQPPAVTSLPPEYVGPDALLELVREHLANYCGERAFVCRQRYNTARERDDRCEQIWLDQAEIWDRFRDQFR